MAYKFLMDKVQRHLKVTPIGLESRDTQILVNSVTLTCISIRVSGKLR